ncbi:hypothetical protein TOPH_07584 [Tolypocladium ophioglossoides CBS 100239]|uniref:Uncharacterized protein n=1 Tax=Tolypocladium ophioglossoides (strain CBS 100239) TaxID=1163406 RepID=A0A0L0N1U0_TOLOC|nr:hypothetical protein TOPH_07584 [Tolypocladium ophioglossoides CBS 100239]
MEQTCRNITGVHEDFRLPKSYPPYEATIQGGSERERTDDVTAFSPGPSIVQGPEASEIATSWLPCEFLQPSGCRMTFPLHDVEPWIEHMISQHLHDKFPSHGACWFCDHVEISMALGRQEDREKSYRRRMHHIAEHFRGGKTFVDNRWDFSFLIHYDWALLQSASQQSEVRPAQGTSFAYPPPSREPKICMPPQVEAQSPTATEARESLPTNPFDTSRRQVLATAAERKHQTPHTTLIHVMQEKTDTLAMVGPPLICGRYIVTADDCREMCKFKKDSSRHTDDSGYLTAFTKNDGGTTAPSSDAFKQCMATMSGESIRSVDSGYHSAGSIAKRQKKRDLDGLGPEHCPVPGGSKGFPFNSRLKRYHTQSENSGQHAELAKNSQDKHDAYTTGASKVESLVDNQAPVLAIELARETNLSTPQATALDPQEVTSTGKENSQFLGETTSTEELSRSPSPWQACGLPGENSRLDNTLIRSLSWIMNNRLGGETTDPEARSRCSSSQPDFHTDSETTESLEGVTTHAGGSSSNEPLGHLYGQGTASVASTGCKTGNKRQLLPVDQRQGQDEEDDPGQKRQKSSENTPERPFTRPRFACPYQRYDPIGSPFCCMPSPKNPDGGADTFPRIK